MTQFQESSRDLNAVRGEHGDSFASVFFTDASNGWATSNVSVQYGGSTTGFAGWQASMWHSTDGGQNQVEAGCKVVVGTRLKRAGMHWTEYGSNAITALRACRLSGRFQDSWERRSQRRAACLTRGVSLSCCTPWAVGWWACP